MVLAAQDIATQSECQCERLQIADLPSPLGRRAGDEGLAEIYPMNFRREMNSLCESGAEKKIANDYKLANNNAKPVRVERILAFDWSREGNLVASRGVVTSDVVLITDAGP
jgi:hypothetical protein